MARIEIIWLTDDTHCETCGGSWAEGASVKIDGELALSLEPVAACFDGESYSDREVFRRILAHLGHEVVEDDE